jgi:hypothetical protein
VILQSIQVLHDIEKDYTVPEPDQAPLPARPTCSIFATAWPSVKSAVLAWPSKKWSFLGALKQWITLWETL